MLMFVKIYYVQMYQQKIKRQYPPLVTVGAILNTNKYKQIIQLHELRNNKFYPN